VTPAAREQRDRKLALAWHVLDAALAAVGLAWSLYHLFFAPKPLVETSPRR